MFSSVVFFSVGLSCSSGVVLN